MEKYFVEIEDWLNKPQKNGDNMPLVIEAEDGVGKKTLMAKWIDYHLSISKKVYFFKKIKIKKTAIPRYHNTSFRFSWGEQLKLFLYNISYID